jgi:peptidoglycan/xylan/chitin deacetylase (PgdA/CDA1 family)
MRLTTVGKSLVHHVGAAAGPAGPLRQLHRWLLPDVVTVVAYHGLVDQRVAVPNACFMAVERFAEQMEYLARNFTVLHLEEAFAPDAPRAKRPIACVTFDDGFGSLRDLGLPVLERLSIPATVYLVTDLVDSEDTLWYAHLHRAICETSASQVVVGDLRFRLASSRERAIASSSIQEAIKALARPQFDGVLDAVLRQLGVRDRRAAKPWAPSRILRAEEVRRMSRGDLVRFGAHTASHQILTRTDPDDVLREIERSVAAVASLVERPSRTFAYPNGGSDDFDEGTIATIKEAGIGYAVTTIEGPNPRDVDPYRIRRYTISAVESPARFVRQVHHARALSEALLKKLQPGSG